MCPGNQFIVPAKLGSKRGRKTDAMAFFASAFLLCFQEIHFRLVLQEKRMLKRVGTQSLLSANRGTLVRGTSTTFSFGTSSRLATANNYSSEKSSTATTAPAIDPHQVLFYEYVEGMLEKRGPHRASHFQFAQPYADRGELLSGGAWDDVSGGMLLFKATKEKVAEFARNDPYVKAGLVKDYKIKTWSVVIKGKQQ